MLIFFFRFQDCKLNSFIQVGVNGMLWTCLALLSSSLESKLSGVISPSSIYIKWQFIQKMHLSSLQLIPFFYSFLFYNYTHTKSYSEANRCVCIAKCKYDSSSCVCVCGTCSRLLSLSSCDLTDEQSSATCLKVSSSSTTV